MDKICISGGNPLSGTIKVSGAKNAALPLMVASLLSDEPLVLKNVPHTLADIRTLMQVLSELGVDITGDEDLTLHAKNINSHEAPYDLVRKMRASILVLGPLLARLKKASVSLPGGCAIGARPVDLHLENLQKMGAEIRIENGYVHGEAPHGLQGAHIIFAKPSVGATENLLMAASCAKGETILENVAREPEITNLANCLNAMGAEITGMDTDTLTIQGKQKLHGAECRVIADRIETGTWAMAAAITGGKLTLENTDTQHLYAALDVLKKTGADISNMDGEKGKGRFTVSRHATLYATDIITEPFPGFPTDLQAQFMALMTVAVGASKITETIFENRYMHVPELNRMGADIQVDGRVAFVRGRPSLQGAEVMATDLRASVSLVLAALVAEGDTTINRIYHLDRGYENLEEKLLAVGADIERVKG